MREANIDNLSIDLDLNSEAALENIRARMLQYEEINIRNFENLKKLNDLLMKKLEEGPSHPQVTEKTRKLQILIVKLSEMISEKLDLSKSIESKHVALKIIYSEHMEKMISDKQMKTSSSKDYSQDVSDELLKEIQDARLERDKAMGLVKVLLATLTSSRMQSEDNFHKLKYSSDLMFHIMYKAEDAFLEKE